MLAQLEAEFGAPAPLERDMKYLLETADLADALLVFRPAGAGGDAHPHSFELPCHKAVLSARSPFFKAFIDRRMKLTEAGGERARGKAPIRIELDESVLPRRYAYVLLRIMYMDTVDLSLILHSSSEPSVCRPISLVDEAIELYQIGRFVELDVLTQASEDLILEALCVESLPRILRWSAEPHGSQWVHRQVRRLRRLAREGGRWWWGGMKRYMGVGGLRSDSTTIPRLQACLGVGVENTGTPKRR